MRGETTIKLVKMCAAAVLAFGVSVGTAFATVIDFGGLAGANGAAFSSYSQAGFTVNATAGSWFEAHNFGNPVPSIFAGPIGSPSLSTVRVTDGGSDFTFAAVDFSSNNGSSTYSIQGLLNGIIVLNMSGTTGGFPGPWNTVSNGSGTPTIDELLLTLIPIGGTTSMNLDNINVSTVVNPAPEPATLALLAFGLGALGFSRRKKAKVVS